MMPSALRTSLLFRTAIGGLLATGLAAQNLSLDQTGGAIGGVTTFRLQGSPAETYAIVFDFQEQVTPIPALGITLAITDTFAGNSYVLPGFFGNTAANGSANASLTIPNDPTLAGLVVSLQAVAGQTSFRVSNLLRLTPQVSRTWAEPLNQPTVPIAGGTTALVANNEILFVGGSGPVAQKYKSRTEQWEAAGTTFGVGILAQTTALADGRILFTGGLDLTTGQPTDAAGIYDPATQTTTTLTMARPRAGHGASLMGNGRVLITGGLATFDFNNLLALFAGIQNTSEFFDPVTNTFVPGPNMLEARALHTSTTLTNGQVLIAGGLTLIPILNIPLVSATAYRFNFTTNSFGFPATFAGGRFLHSAAPTDNGRVLLAGGLTLDFSVFLQTGQIQDLIIGTRSDCQLFAASGSFGTFTTVNGMQEGRAGAAIATLPNGGAVIAGGFQLTINASTNQFEIGATATTDVFTQNPNTITPAAPMSAPRLFPVALPLPDGTVMVVGGGPTGAEIFQR